MTITWATTEKTDSLVRYGPTSIYGSERAGTTVYSAGLGLYLHTVKLDGLTPNTAYHYSCGARRVERRPDLCHSSTPRKRFPGPEPAVTPAFPAQQNMKI